MIPEREREALMRLTMCAREECSMCKYNYTCNFDFQYETATRCMNILAEALRKTEPTISKMEQVEDETRLTAKCLNCANGSSYKCSKCDGEMYYKYDKDEPQGLEQFRVGLEYHTDTTHFGKTKGESIATNKVEDEPQTERSE